ncbi:hypothetical protein H0H81_005278 [Sphagnurus paluster]|uniref:NTF2 domain-containing protein n=1 Tax=Sphagnurus paluster TaxID=117069 RepID=A0A9P7FU03_9AGAR|nr:hypothetical protein H0H81_005278 [Sphagnurus paluster]
MSARAFSDRRPDPFPKANGTSSAHREDQQPNEGINKRQRAGPPSILPTSFPQHRRGVWNVPRGGNPPLGSSRGSGWTQHPVRGDRNWKNTRGGHAVRNFSHEPRPPAPHYERYSSTTTEHSWNKWYATSHHHHTLQFPPRSEYPFENAPKKQPYAAQHDTRTNNGTIALSSPPSTLEASSPSLNVSQHRCDGLSGTDASPTSSTNLSPTITIPHQAFQPHETSSSFTSNSPIPRSLLDDPSKHFTYTEESSPPSKRRRLDSTPEFQFKAEEIEIPGLLSTIAKSSLLEVAVKTERRSPTPPSRRLVTQSCTMFPLPDECRKMNPGYNPEYIKNRQALVAKERGRLKRRGFKVIHVLFRDDGMVIEWTSSVPVWSDTLLPNSESESSEAEICESPVPKPKYLATEPIRSQVPFALPKPKVKTKALRRSCSRDSDGEARELPDPHTGSEYKQSKPSGPPPKPLPLPVPSLPQRKRSIGDSPPVSSSSSPPFHPGAQSIGSPPPTKLKGKGKAVEIEVELEVQHQKKQPSIPHTGRPIPLPFHSSHSKASTSREPKNDTSSTVTPATQEIEIVDSVGVILEAWSVDQLPNVEPMAIDFLERYMRALDADTATLRCAYAPYASFSCRTSSSLSTAGSGSSVAGPSSGPLHVPSSSMPARGNLCQGPDAILAQLEQLGSLKFFAGGDMAHDVRVHYDVVSLCEAAGGGILLAVYSEVVDPKFDQPKGEVFELDQAFVLQRRQGGVEGRGGESMWPLVAVAHQMFIRESTPGPPKTTSLDKDFPWLK